MTATWTRLPALAAIISAVLLVPTTAGAAKMPAIAWSPNGTVSYGTLDAADGQTSSQKFTLSNADGGTSGTLAVSMGGASTFSVSADSCSGKKLAPKKTCTVTVTYAPTANGGDSAILSATSATGASANVSLSGSSAWQAGDLTTYTQTEWGNDDSENTSASDLLTAQFNSVYAATFGVLVVGLPSPGYSMSLTDANAVFAYLPAAGPIGPLDANLSDPLATSSGEFGGDVTALQLNVDFSDAGLLASAAGLKFGDLTICNSGVSAIDRASVRQLLSALNSLLGGGTSSYGSIQTLDPIAIDLSDAFIDGMPSTWAQAHLQPGMCP